VFVMIGVTKSSNKWVTTAKALSAQSVKVRL
ncbi:putative amino acid ABC transporter amino acid-binding protein, partial [Vibrio parahaemolyticus V-223/04]